MQRIIYNFWKNLKIRNHFRNFHGNGWIDIGYSVQVIRRFRYAIKQLFLDGKLGMFFILLE